jgi:hypothetical protein
MRYPTSSQQPDITRSPAIDKCPLGIKMCHGDRGCFLGEVKAFRVEGLKCYFGSNDHYPQHFEVSKRGCWVIRVYILRSNRKRGLNWDYKLGPWAAGPLPAEREELLALVLRHRKRLLSQWNTDVNVATQRKESFRTSQKETTKDAP